MSSPAARELGILSRLKIWRAQRKLEKLIAQRRQSYGTIDFAKRREAALKHTRKTVEAR